MTKTYEYNLPLCFQTIARVYASRTAIWFNNDNVVTYRELNEMANRLARHFLALGLRERDVICISGKKDIYAYAAIVASLKIGSIYTMLDPDSPVERLSKIFATCKPRLLFGDKDLIKQLLTVTEKAGITCVISSPELAATIKSYDSIDFPSSEQITGANASYIMFTSGSTGMPKGAVMTHANVLNLISWGRRTFDVKPEDILTNVNPLYFDNSVFDFYSAIFNGACLVPFTKEETRDPRQLVEKAERAQCTTWFSVPSLLIFLQTMKALDGKRMTCIKRFIFGGEGYPKAKLKPLFDAYYSTSSLHNVYGPTECTCICSSYTISADDFSSMHELPPLGRIAENFSYLIINDDGNLAKPGETGELCLLGPNVGKGYYNDPDRTSAAFIQNPFNTAYTEPMYKTGDLVHLNPEDGKLYIHGRKDNQIKHMGYRIELEEIETALNRIEYVSEAMAFHFDGDGLSRIIAILAARQQANDGQLRQDLRKLIPDYMIPSTFYYEEALPKNPNGKVDRKHLKEIYLARDAERRKK